MVRFHKHRRAFMVLAAAALCGTAARADDKPVTLMVPYPAGGPSDAIARIVNMPLGKALGQQVLVDNLGGVSGALAAQKVLSAPADGRMLFQGSPNEVILSPLANAAVKLKAEDFTLVHPIGNAVLVLITRKDLPVNSADELIDLARKSKDKPLTYGSVGIGSLYHLVVEDAARQTGTVVQHVPYKGNAPVLQDLGGGMVDFAVLVYSTAMGALAEQGKLKVIGQLGATRSELLPSVPTVAESRQLKNFNYTIWSGLMVRKDTPAPVVEKLHKSMAAMLQDAEVRKQLAAQSQTAAPAMSLAESARFFEAETARYRRIARDIKLQAQ
jgi:tripartite-type tricarboxylate transporter receptor subunit TctC